MISISSLAIPQSKEYKHLFHYSLLALLGVSPDAIRYHTPPSQTTAHHLIRNVDEMLIQSAAECTQIGY